MKSYKIIDNVLPESELENLKELINSNGVPFYFNKSLNGNHKKENNMFYMTHLLYNWDNNCPSTISTFTGLSSPTCPTGTTEVEPNCIIPATTGSPAIPQTAFVPEQPFVPAIPSSAGTPNTYTMNCWQQMCPSTLNTYSGQTSPVCPTGTQVNEPCLDSTGSSAFSGSGFSGYVLVGRDPHSRIHLVGGAKPIIGVPLRSLWVNR